MVTTPTGGIFQIQASATTGNVNGAGFNPTATYFFTDLAATSANTTTPVVSSASYNFVSPGDVGNYVYVKSGTHWQAGWYQIASVAANAATLTATIGSVITSVGSTGIVVTNSTAGCTSDNTATLSGGTWGLDYSQSDAATATSTTATSSGAGSVILFAGSTASMLGNYVNIISGTNATAGWYEIIAESAGVSITTDRASTTGAGANIVMNIGGAGRLNGLEDSFQATLPAGGIVFVKNGSYTISGAISTASTNGTGTSAIYWRGYNTTRGDTCNGTNRPALVLGANAVSLSQNQLFYNFSATSTTAAGITTRTGNVLSNFKMQNNSTTAARVGITLAGNFAGLVNCEIVSQNGTAVAVGNSAEIFITGCYIHDSNIGITQTNAQSGHIVGNIIASCTTKAIGLTNSNQGGNFIANNTIYGREAKVGIGIDLAANNPSCRVINNIIYGLTTGINVATGTGTSSIGSNNDFFNNTADNTNWIKDTTDLALNPNFTGASQVINTGTVSTSGSVLTDTTGGFNGNVVDNSSYLHVTANTSGNTGVFLITSHTNTTVTTDNALGTGTSTTYWITTGQNFQIGTNLKAQGFPSFTNQTTSQTTSYPDIGGVQRQEPTAASGGSFTFVG